MKFLIINNKNDESLSRLVDSLKKHVKGPWTFCTFDSTQKLEMIGPYNITGNKNLKEWLSENLMGELDDNYCIIDENKIVIDDIDIQTIDKTMSDEEVFCFSLVLGKNITHCSNMNCDNIFKPTKEEEGVLFWDWSVHYFDFGYPLNLDGTVFRGKEIRKFIKSISFNNSMELENALQIFDNYPKNIMTAFSQNKMIEVIFEKPELFSTFNYDNLEKNRTKYQILENIKTMAS